MPVLTIGAHVRRREDRQAHPVIGTVIATHGLSHVTVAWELPQRPGQPRRITHDIAPRAALIVLKESATPPERTPESETP